MANNIALLSHLDEVTQVIGNDNKNAKIILLCIKQGIDRDVWRAHSWSVLRRFYSFVESPVEAIYPLPDDFGWYVNDSAWNITTKERMLGPLDSYQWQKRVIPDSTLSDRYTAFMFAGIGDQWSIGGSASYNQYSPRIIINPTPGGGSTSSIIDSYVQIGDDPVEGGSIGGISEGDWQPQAFSIAYISRNLVAGADGSAKSVFSADSDRPIIASSIVEQAGLVRLKRSLGISFADDMDELQSLIQNWKRKEGGMKRMNAVSRNRSRFIPNVPDSGYGV